MAGQTMIDRLTAARHSIAGHGLAKSVCKATTEEVMGPKKKHVDYLLQCTNEPNVSIPQMADLLIERTQNNNWVVVFKALITIHNVMNYGNERFTQYLASNNCTFNLGNFLDKSGVQGYDMSTYIRRYAKYLNEKAFSYRQMAYDFCKIKRGKNDGTLRTMTGEKLLKALPVLQSQVDALLEFDCTSNELTNGVINACFMLMFKDLIRLFACYNDGIINLLEKFFEMPKKQCREALDFYKKFLTRMDRVSEFLKIAESVGIDKGDIPDLAKAPSSLLEALEAHLVQLEGNKKGEKRSKQPDSVSTAISSLAASASGGPGASTVSEDEKRKILEEESRQLQMLKEDSEKPTSTNPFANALEDQNQRVAEIGENNPFSSSLNNGSVTSPSGGLDLLGAGSPSAMAGDMPAAGNDLLGLGGPNPFGAAVVAQPQTDLFGAPSTAGGSPWGTPAPSTGSAPVSTAPSNTSGFASDAQFAAVFGSGSSQTTGGPMVNTTTPPKPGGPMINSTASPGSGSSPNAMMPANSFDGFGEVMRPSGGTAPPPNPHQGQQGIMPGSLDMSLSSLASNLNINSQQAIKKTGHQWGPQGEKKLTGGTTWAQPMGQAASGLTSMAQPMGTSPMMAAPHFSMGAAPMTGMSHMGAAPMNGVGPAINGMNPAVNGMSPAVNSGMPPSWPGPGMMGAQPGFAGQQMAFQQQPMGMAAPMGVQQQGMFMAAQPGQPQPMFNQPRPPQPGAAAPNDPFGAL